MRLASTFDTGRMTETPKNNAEQERAVLFADISGSTRLYEILGDTRALATINGCLGILQNLTQQHHGRVVKTIGDEIMAVFPDADTAVQTACEMQLAVTNMPPVDKMRVAIRIGFHCGPVIESEIDGDVFGDTVNTAARMSNIAKGGQIITSAMTVAKLPKVMRASARSLDALTVKGKAEDIEVFEIIWQESSEMTMLSGRTQTMSAAQAILRLVHQGEEFFVGVDRPFVNVGRDTQADIVIHDRMASRAHAKIERRRDKFVFIDQSTNGSYITINGENEIQLRREELLLRGSGRISFGHSYSKDPSEIVEFFCSY
jgi:class 3 adenylate cyclase